MKASEKYASKVVLVTGGAGFIGSNFIRYLLKINHQVEVYNLDALTYAGSLQNLKDLADPERHHFIEGDIREQELVEGILRENSVDTLIHFAAESHVDRSIAGPDLFIQTNFVGTYRLLEAVKKVWLDEWNWSSTACRFHHISTDEVYGSLSREDPPFSETTPYAPNSPYAASKAASDHLVRAYAHTYGLPVSITNCSNNYGPYQFPEKFIPLIITNALAGEPIPVYGDGQQIRDWLFVEDHCEAIWVVLTRGSIGTTFNIGGDNQPTNLEIVETLCGILDEKVPDSPYKPHRNLISFVRDRPGHDRRYAMDIRKIQSDLGWLPTTHLSQGLRKTVDWYLENGDWLNEIKGELSYREWIEQQYHQREEKQ